MRLIRVFPRRTKASPNDELSYFGPPDLFAQADLEDVGFAESRQADMTEEELSKRGGRPATEYKLTESGIRHRHGKTAEAPDGLVEFA